MWRKFKSKPTLGKTVNISQAIFNSKIYPLGFFSSVFHPMLAAKDILPISPIMITLNSSFTCIPQEQTMLIKVSVT